MRELQKGSLPGFDNDHPATLAKNAMHFHQSFLQAFRQSRKVVQTALNDQHVLALIRKRHLAAVGHVAFCCPPIQCHQPRRKVDPLQSRETQASKGVKPVATPAKELDNTSISRQLSRAQFLESLQKLPNFFFGCFKSDVSSLPRIVDTASYLGSN